jgi:hypothetical protein
VSREDAIVYHSLQCVEVGQVAGQARVVALRDRVGDQLLLRPDPLGIRVGRKPRALFGHRDCHPSPGGYRRAKSSDSTTYEICVAKIAGTKKLELKSSESMSCEKVPNWELSRE